MISVVGGHVKKECCGGDYGCTTPARDAHLVVESEQWASRPVAVLCGGWEKDEHKGHGPRRFPFAS